MEERLQKVIARAGVSSRRAAEEMILAGRVRVNGRIITELGAKADPFKDKVELDGKRLVLEEPHYLVLHKPRNVVSTVSDPEGRATVAEYFRKLDVRVYPIGRLDFATSGVLLVTNDGEFSNGLLHPKRSVPKTYVLKVQGVMEEEDVERWRSGVQLEDGPTRPAEARILRVEDDKTWLEVTLREGRNQQIRRMGEATGFRVMRLARIAFAGITSEGLRPGDWRSLTKDELLSLREEYGVPKRIRGAAMPEAQLLPRGRAAWTSRSPLQRPHAQKRATAPGGDTESWGRSSAGAARTQERSFAGAVRPQERASAGSERPRQGGPARQDRGGPQARDTRAPAWGREAPRPRGERQGPVPSSGAWEREPARPSRERQAPAPTRERSAGGRLGPRDDQRPQVEGGGRRPPRRPR